MTRAARGHRALDAAHAEAIAREGGSMSATGTSVRARDRLKDLRTMDRPKRPRVLLAQLSVRTSAKGRHYLSGWLGKASVVGFEGEPDRYGNPVWDIFVSEPEPRDAALDASTIRAKPQER